MVGTEYPVRLSELVVTQLPPPALVSVPPALILRILGRVWCQSAGSAGLATDLQSAQAVKAA